MSDCPRRPRIAISPTSEVLACIGRREGFRELAAAMESGRNRRDRSAAEVSPMLTSPCRSLVSFARCSDPFWSRGPNTRG